ncbi:MAG TPA: hypothetical protein VF911_14885, partial [Thermoanaerobaculia bacterium]
AALFVEARHDDDQMHAAHSKRRPIGRRTGALSKPAIPAERRRFSRRRSTLWAYNDHDADWSTR